MIIRCNVSEFLRQTKDLALFDARSPGEFASGHIPGAINLPVFDDAERAEVGTIYVRQSRELATLRALEIVGPKLRPLAETARQLAPTRCAGVHCWRGGMRSAGLAWLLDVSGFEVYLLEGGYKNWRTHARQGFLSGPPLIVLGGMTGSGKTAILHELALLGEQVLDLEGLAHHRGSAFGSFGMAPQPTTEQFENDCAAAWAEFDPARPVWTEDESLKIGKVVINEALFARLRQATVVTIQIPREYRLQRLFEEYAGFDPTELALAINNISKRLGGADTSRALEAIDAQDMRTAIDIVLAYYDRSYNHSRLRRTDSRYIDIDLPGSNPADDAKTLLAMKNSFIP